MYTIDSIRVLHLEISSNCNAACPLCPRNFHGYPFNDGYTEHSMTLSEAQTIFTVEFIQQLDHVHVNGNFGDIVMNPEAIDILSHFRTTNPSLQISISTNGGARNSEFWSKLADLRCMVYFCIDGLEDTHHLYRQNTLYSTVIKNAQTFIQAGGNAVWKMIDFDHSRHQQDMARQLSQEFGFQNFELVDHGRNSTPVFDKNRQLTHIIGSPRVTDFQQLMDWRKHGPALAGIIASTRIKNISCVVKKTKSVYVSSTGHVYPCCYLGFSPETDFGGIHHKSVNAQLRPLIKHNNAIEHGLSESIQWFNEVEKSWDIDSFENGRLIMCNDTCGS